MKNVKNSSNTLAECCEAQIRGSCKKGKYGCRLTLIEHLLIDHCLPVNDRAFAIALSKSNNDIELAKDHVSCSYVKLGDRVLNASDEDLKNKILPNPEGYFLTIVRNTCIDYHRKSSTKNELPQSSFGEDCSMDDVLKLSRGKDKGLLYGHEEDEI